MPRLGAAKRNELLTGFSLSSQVLHLMGASAGFGVAILMLKKLAQILIDFANRPEDARDVLEPLQPASESEKDGERIRALRRRAGARNLGAME